MNILDQWEAQAKRNEWPVTQYLQDRVLVLIELVRKKDEALQFYAHPKKDLKPGDRNEFGCSCCAGTIDSDGICDHNRNIVGLTAREALSLTESLGEK